MATRLASARRSRQRLRKGSRQRLSHRSEGRGSAISQGRRGASIHTAKGRSSGQRQALPTRSPTLALGKATVFSPERVFHLESGAQLGHFTVMMRFSFIAIS